MGKVSLNVGSQDTPHTQFAAMVGHFFLQGNEQNEASRLMPFVQEDMDDTKSKKKFLRTQELGKSCDSFQGVWEYCVYSFNAEVSWNRQQTSAAYLRR